MISRREIPLYITSLGDIRIRNKTFKWLKINSSSFKPRLSVMRDEEFDPQGCTLQDFSRIERSHEEEAFLALQFTLCFIRIVD